MGLAPTKLEDRGVPGACQALTGGRPAIHMQSAHLAHFLRRRLLIHSAQPPIVPVDTRGYHRGERHRRDLPLQAPTRQRRQAETILKRPDLRKLAPPAPANRRSPPTSESSTSLRQHLAHRKIDVLAIDDLRARLGVSEPVDDGLLWHVTSPRPLQRLSALRQTRPRPTRRRVVKRRHAIGAKPAQQESVCGVLLIGRRNPRAAENAPRQQLAVDQDLDATPIAAADDDSASRYAWPARLPPSRRSLDLRRELGNLRLGTLKRHMQVMRPWLATPPRLLHRPASRLPGTARLVVSVQRSRPTRHQFQPTRRQPTRAFERRDLLMPASPRLQTESLWSPPRLYWQRHLFTDP